MATAKHSVYEPANLAEYSFTERLKIRAAAWLFYVAIKVIGSTLKFETRGIEHFDEVERAGKTPIYCFWHDRIFTGTYFFRNRGVVIMTSRSFDGEYIARFIQKFGYGAVRGSSSRGAVRALVEMIKAAREGLPMGFALDGPRGPRYEVKPGAITLAAKTGDPLVPFVLQPRRYWTIESWDRMQIPKPFTRVLVTVGEPIYVPRDADEAEREAKRNGLASSLLKLVDEATEWAQSD